MKKNEDKKVGWVKWLAHFLMHDIFRITENELSNSTRILIRLLKKLVLSIRGFVDDALMIKASALTYYTMLAIVPIFALFLSIGRGFGVQDVLSDWIYKLLGDNYDITPFVMEFVNNYLEQAHGGVFVGVGIVLLLWAVVSMFRQIEAIFNRIWNVKKNRSIVRQFTTYLTILIVTPLMIVVSSSLSVIINEYVEVVAKSQLGSFIIPIYQFLLKLVPFVIYWVLFTILFMVIPNTKVRLKDAILSGVITGSAFLFLQFIYVSGQISLSKYNAVYGSFAAIPLLLFWLQISWLIVLYGAELCYVSQNLLNYSFEHDTKRISRRYKDYTLLIILKIIINRFEKNEAPISANSISTEYNIPIRLVMEHLKILSDTNIISEIYKEEDTEKVYQPAMDINILSLKLVSEKINMYGSENFSIKKDPIYENVWERVGEIRNVVSDELDNTLIKDL